MKTIEKPKTGKATRPASRWRNRIFVLRDFTALGGVPYRPGEQWGLLEWPSRDTAETYAQEWVSRHPGHIQYLGAFPMDAA